MKVIGEHFYHISRSAEFIQKMDIDGELLIDGNNFNKHIQDILGLNARIDLGDGDRGIINALFHFPDKVKDTIPNWPDGIMTILINILSRYSALVFENVRLAHFNSLPSRLTSIFLCDKDSLAKWYAAISPDNESPIYELSCVGDCHIADQSWYQDMDVCNHEYFIDSAMKYWQGNKKHSESVMEILFKGKITKINKFNHPSQI
jgi:hypothetical protein